MKILVINGSPKGKNSNTYRLTQAFLEGIRLTMTKKGQQEALEIHELTVGRLQIRPCLGCFSCWNKTPGKCCITDDMAQVLEELLWADVTVWSFPLYYFSVPGPLKNLMDRQLPMVMPFMKKDTASGGHESRYDVGEKRHVVISTCGFYTAEGNYDGVNALFDHLCGKGNYTTIYCGQGELFRVKELASRTDAYLEMVRRAGQEYCEKGISQDSRQRLSTLLYPREVFEAMADASWGVEKDGETADETLIFTRQMAALYRKSSFNGKRQVLEMYYTDVEKRYQILLEASGSRVLTEDFQEYTTRIETPYTVWKEIAEGTLSGQDALMKQMYRVKGDFQLMIHWDQYFGPENGEESNEENHVSGRNQSAVKTHMNCMLVPWIVFWVAAAIHPFYGSLVSILAVAAVNLLYLHNKKTIYDGISGVLVSALSVMLLLNVNARIIVPVSYLCFGIMWTVSAFFRIPLTAHYSMNDYQGEAALANPLFIKTNRILTICWGILYLLTPIWTWFLMGSSLGSLTGAINSILPLLMGIFTGWFQKWYPAKVAQGK